MQAVIPPEPNPVTSVTPRFERNVTPKPLIPCYAVTRYTLKKRENDTVHHTTPAGLATTPFCGFTQACVCVIEAFHHAPPTPLNPRCDTPKPLKKSIFRAQSL